MFKVNLTGAPETVVITDDAGLICAPRDLQTLADVMQANDQGDDGESFGFNELAKALALEVVQDWYGLVDIEGNEIAFDADLIEPVVSDPMILQAFRAGYLDRMMFLREEGNGSQPSQTGTSGAEPATAKAASKPAKPARTKKTSRKAKKV